MAIAACDDDALRTIFSYLNLDSTTVLAVTGVNRRWRHIMLTMQQERYQSACNQTLHFLSKIIPTFHVLANASFSSYNSFPVLREAALATRDKIFHVIHTASQQELFNLATTIPPSEHRTFPGSKIPSVESVCRAAALQLRLLSPIKLTEIFEITPPFLHSEEIRNGLHTGDLQLPRALLEKFYATFSSVQEGYGIALRSVFLISEASAHDKDRERHWKWLDSLPENADLDNNGKYAFALECASFGEIALVKECFRNTSFIHWQQTYIRNYWISCCVGRILKQPQQERYFHFPGSFSLLPPEQREEPSAKTPIMLLHEMFTEQKAFDIKLTEIPLWRIKALAYREGCFKEVLEEIQIHCILRIAKIDMLKECAYISARQGNVKDTYAFVEHILRLQIDSSMDIAMELYAQAAADAGQYEAALAFITKIIDSTKRPSVLATCLSSFAKLGKVSVILDALLKNNKDVEWYFNTLIAVITVLAEAGHDRSIEKLLYLLPQQSTLHASILSTCMIAFARNGIYHAVVKLHTQWTFLTEDKNEITYASAIALAEKAHKFAEALALANTLPEKERPELIARILSFQNDYFGLSG